MTVMTLKQITAFLAAIVAISGMLARGDEPQLTAEMANNSVTISAGKQPVAAYFYADDKIARPFYAHVCTADGIAVTRNFPPKDGEPADHGDMHPGIWLAFGDLSGQDFWRNKGRVKQVKFLAEPKGDGNRVSFTVRNEYVVMVNSVPQKIAAETCRHIWSLHEGQLLVSLDSEFEPAEGGPALVFGDQEEMGLGVRVASPLRVKDAGGEIRTSDGLRNEKEAWGKPAKWCDYRGTVDGRSVGVTLMPHSDNFRESWFHVRDYGLMVANPFGQNAFTRKEKSRVEVKPGEKLRLRFGIWIHSGKSTANSSIEAAYRSFLELAGESHESGGKK